MLSFFNPLRSRNAARHNGGQGSSPLPTAGPSGSTGSSFVLSPQQVINPLRSSPVVAGHSGDLLESAIGDSEQITHDELRVSILLAGASKFPETSRGSDLFLNSSPSFLSRLSKPSTYSLRRRQKAPRPEPRTEKSLVLAFPRPPTHHTPGAVSPTSAVYSHQERQFPERSSALKRLQSFASRSKSLLSRQQPTPQIFRESPTAHPVARPALCQPVPVPPSVPSIVVEPAPPQQLSFEQIDFSVDLGNRNSWRCSVVRSDEPAAPQQENQHLGVAVVPYRRRSYHAFEYERVDPRDLTPSPIEPSGSYSSTAPWDTPLPPGTPSWLSRNVREVENAIQQSSESPALPIRPPPSPEPASPPPLHILPRCLVPDQPRRTYSFQYEETPATPSTASSVTLFNDSRRTSLLSPAYPVERRSSSRLSTVHFRQSIVESGSNRLSCITIAVEDCGDASVCDQSPPPPNLLLLPPATQESRLSPLTPLDTDQHRICSLPSQPPSSVPPDTPQRGPYSIFVPVQQEETADPKFPIPAYLPEIAKLVASTTQLTKMTSNVYGKPTDVVDWGEEVDYTQLEWFKEPPPPRPEAQQQPPPAPEDSYPPHPVVIEQNEMFQFALKSAPNVLYARFKQYGQLGVLGWCSEFSEMIDELKILGQDGNLFVVTRAQALKTCEELLRLLGKMKIDMQIIVMFLCSQVARMRRFLDNDNQFDDYPQYNFPIDPRAYPPEPRAYPPEPRAFH